ncbi:hypothetical protein EYF80_046762 [Liparis tanakae]|uniref:Uncharacterized protein n=1 Tax=Liparis tanakae TaxID=230148 RepID=A0A4Z2FRP3_9TELE|nr:hypothetical protein EYF80_046762 [Liparis tanakae]
MSHPVPDDVKHEPRPGELFQGFCSSGRHDVKAENRTTKLELDVERSCRAQRERPDYGSNGGLCTARASEETTPTHEAPPPPFPLTTRRQQSPIAPLRSALHDPSTLRIPDMIIPSFGQQMVYPNPLDLLSNPPCSPDCELGHAMAGSYYI